MLTWVIDFGKVVEDWYSDSLDSLASLAKLIPAASRAIAFLGERLGDGIDDALLDEAFNLSVLTLEVDTSEV